MTLHLQETLDTLAAQFPGQISFYARNLNTGDELGRAADLQQTTMSAGKLFVLLAYTDAVAHQQLDPGARVTMLAEDVLPGTGAIRYCAPGISLAVGDLAALMITHSDNAATNLLLRAIGGTDAVNATLDRFGIVDARCVSPLFQGDFSISSARALAQTCSILMNPDGAGFPAAAAALALSILSRSQDLEGMSRHLPWSPLAADFGFDLPLKVYSKSGQFPGTQVEAGLYVTSSGAYVAAAMCTNIPDPRTHSPAPGSQFLAAFGRQLYEAWGGNPA